VSSSTFRFRADTAFIRTVTRSQTTGRMRAWRVAAAGLAVCSGVAIGTGHPVLGVVAAILFLAAMAGSIRALRPVRGVAASMFRQYAQLPPPKEIEVRVDDEGIDLANGLGSTSIPWERVVSVHQGTTVWWVHVDSGESLPLPAAQMPSAAQALIAARAPATTR
jgi:hypothetical protein